MPSEKLILKIKSTKMLISLLKDILAQLLNDISWLKLKKVPINRMTKDIMAHEIVPRRIITLIMKEIINFK